MFFFWFSPSTHTHEKQLENQFFFCNLFHGSMTCTRYNCSLFPIQKKNNIYPTTKAGRRSRRKEPTPRNEEVMESHCRSSVSFLFRIFIIHFYAFGALNCDYIIYSIFSSFFVVSSKACNLPLAQFHPFNIRNSRIRSRLWISNDETVQIDVLR